MLGLPAVVRGAVSNVEGCAGGWWGSSGGSMCWRKYSGMLWYRDRLDEKLTLFSLAVWVVLSVLVASAV